MIVLGCKQRAILFKLMSDGITPMGIRRETDEPVELVLEEKGRHGLGRLNLERTEHLVDDETAHHDARDRTDGRDRPLLETKESIILVMILITPFVKLDTKIAICRLNTGRESLRPLLKSLILTLIPEITVEDLAHKEFHSLNTPRYDTA